LRLLYAHSLIISSLLFPPARAGFELHAGAVSSPAEGFHEQQSHEAEDGAVQDQPEHHVADNEEHRIVRYLDAGVDGDLDEVLVDLFVAVFARGLQILFIDRGFWIVGFINVMDQTRCMAADAVGGLLLSQGDHLAVNRLLIGLDCIQRPAFQPQFFHQGDIAMTAAAERHDFLGRSRSLMAQAVHDMPIGLRHPCSLVTVQAAVQRFAIGNGLFVDSLIDRVQMAILAIRIGGLHQGRIAGFNRMDA
jgi:hypothetical protein